MPYFGPQQPFQAAQPGQPLPSLYSSWATQPPFPPRDTRKRKRVLWILTAVVVVLALGAAGVIALTSGRSGNSIVAKVTCVPSDLTSCLIKAPAGGIQLTSTDTSTSNYYQSTTPTPALYQSDIAHDASGVGTDTSAMLGADSMRKMAHVDWNAVDGDDVDLVVLQFGSQKGAQDWNSSRTGEILAAYRGQAVTIPGDSTGKALAATKVDSQGNIDAAYSAVVGDLVLNVDYSSPKQLSAADLQSWAGTELASLHTAPAAAPDAADVAVGTEQLACGTLSSCLMPMPRGGQRWPSANGKLWVKGTTLTSNQFVQMSWDGDTDSVKQTVESNFTANGVTGIDHEDWSIDDGYKQADIYLIQTITAGGATKLAGENFGQPDWDDGLSGTAFTVPNEPDSQAWYTNKDKDGFVDFYVMQVIGNVIVHGWMYFYGSFDSATATTWAQAELNFVKPQVSTQPMGLFPLTAPTLPAATQGTCPASGDCLLPLPAGATDSTALSYYTGEDIDAGNYATQYDVNASSSGTDISTWMTGSDGFKSGKHRSWTAADGAVIDTALLQYGTPAEARAATLLEYGGNASADRVCTDPAVPDSMCVATQVNPTDPLQMDTIWVMAWKGDYEVSVSVTVSDTADVADAYATAQQQLDLLPAS